MYDDPSQATPEDSSADMTPAPAWSTNGVGDHADGPAAEAAPDAKPAADDDFVDELLKAMKSAAATERTRIAEEIDRRRADHIATIHGRRDSEADRIRQLADEDRKSIESWAQDEHRRITEEQERRTAALQADLESSLAEHGNRIDGEIQRVEAAIAAHRTDVDAFFVSIASETDPVAIAQSATRRPAFPALDQLAQPTTDGSGGTATDAPADGTRETAAAVEQASPDAIGGDEASAAAGQASSADDVGVSSAEQPAADAARTTGDEAAVATEGSAEASADDDGTDAVAAPSDTILGEASAAPVAVASGDDLPPSAEEIDTSPETTGIGVMEPLSSAKLAEAWAAWNRSTLAADTDTARHEAERTEVDSATEAAAEVATKPAGAYVEPAEPVGAVSAPSGSGAESRTNAPFSNGPGFARMSWLRRDKDHGNNS